MTTLDVVVGRQPIFDRDLTVYGYELLFRSLRGLTPMEAAAGSGDNITADVLFNTVSIGVQRLVGDKKLFCNASRGVFTGVVPIMLPPEQTVVEILESVLPELEVLAGCRRIRDEGYLLALDDVCDFACAEPFMELASFVKIDIRKTDQAHLPVLVEQCRQFDVALLAEKVETEEEVGLCAALGFDYFQGFALAWPCRVPGRALDPGRMAQLRMATRLLDSECPIAELEDIVRSDPAMTLQLLQLAGIGAAHGMRRTVRTVREALVLIGWRRLQSWIALLLIAGKGKASDEQITTALTRARTCELVAGSLDGSLSQSAFTAGMLSSLDLMLGMPLDEILEELPIDEEMRRALLLGEGTLGRIVTEVSAFQLGRSVGSDGGLEDTLVSTVSLQSLMWAVEATSAISMASVG